MKKVGHFWAIGLKEIGQYDQIAAGLLLAWVLTMIGVPIAIWVGGEATISPMMLMAVTLQAAGVLVLLGRGWGWRTAGSVAALVASCGWLVEALGTNTGFPFGAYDYTGRLQPQIAHVPLLIPLAWFMMLPVCWHIGRVITPLLPQLPFSGTFIFCSAGAMTAWDLFLDPQMVAWHFWVWAEPSGYFGIPWSNYFGWLVASAGITALVTWGIRPEWEKLPAFPFLLIYAITWFLETFGLLFFWGLPGPALVGGLVMGGFLGAAVVQQK